MTASGVLPVMRARHARASLRGAALVAMGTMLGAIAFAEPMRGLPFTRSYPLDEIGYVSRGPRLNFDAFGRLALVQDGVYAVLNDTMWINLAAPLEEVPPMANVVQGPDERAYFGARGVWGVAERAANGKLYPRSLVAGDPPAWTTTAYFDDIVATKEGVYFGSWNGVVFWNLREQRAQFFELAKGVRVFPSGGKVYFSATDQPLHEIDLGGGALRPVPDSERAGTVVEFATPLDATRSLLAFSDGKLMVFDGRTLLHWSGQASNDLGGRISALQRLGDDAVAVAIAGRGLFLLSTEGRLLSALTTNPYHRVTALASREPGVLWVALEDAVEKVLYGGPLTVFGERLGLPVEWPILQRWGEQIVVLSDRKLYEGIPGMAGATGRFRQMPEQPPGGATAITARGSEMLVGSPRMIYAVRSDGTLLPVAPIKELWHLMMVDGDRCFAIGTAEIALLQRENGTWVERVPRIPALRYPPVAHVTRKSVWIELGPDGVARLTEKNGALSLEKIALPWSSTPWVNIGVIDDIVVLSGSEGNRLYYDEKAEAWCDPRELKELFARSPHWILRMKKDDRGTIWANYGSGIISFTPREGGYVMDASRFDLSSERYPALHVLPGGEVWISTQRSLYHVEPSTTTGYAQGRRVALVSVVDARTSEELFSRDGRGSGPLRLSYDQNNLIFRPFSGSYSWRRPPPYQFRLNQAERWTQLDAGSTLSVSELREGRHLLEIRMSDSDAPPGETFALSFDILPPWYRTDWAYGLYLLSGVFAFFGTARAFSYLARRRHRALEELVRARTTELEVAMGRLNEETRNAATLAERDRLAGEIHDSMQQGLSGAIIQLDTTLKMRSVTDDVRSRLNVVRNMVSYSRHEVQHAVWDMESPLLEGTELGEALRKITALVNVGTVTIETQVTGTPIELPRTVKHHLLRIAQEATTNAVRHAQASRITIELKYDPAAIALAIRDDGVGFVPDEMRSKTFGHFGLRGLRARAEKIGGILTIESAAGAGTLVRIVIPAPEPGSYLSSHAKAHLADENTHPSG